MRLARPLLLLALLAAAVSLPLWTYRTNPYLLQLSLNILISAVLALSWDILARTGQLSLAHAAFFGMGGYVSALLALRASIPLPVAIPLGALASLAVAVGLGVLTLRLRGIYFAIATLAFTETLRVVTKQWRFTGSATGLVVPPLAPGNLPLQYWLVLSILLLCVAVSWAVNRSRWWFAFTAIRTNEEVAAVMGVDVVRFKVLAFAISAFFAGITGAYFAHVFLFINPFQQFSLAISVGALVAPIFGGLYTTAGPILGAVALRAGEELLKARFGSGFLIIYGLMLAVVILYIPRGMVGVWTSAVARLSARRRRVAIPAEPAVDSATARSAAGLPPGAPS